MWEGEKAEKRGQRLMRKMLRSLGAKNGERHESRWTLKIPSAKKIPGFEYDVFFEGVWPSLGLFGSGFYSLTSKANPRILE